jgi:ribosomal protein S18 acetylase RimI-like enzyme
MIPLVPRQASFEDYPQVERFYADLDVPGAVPSADVFAATIAPNAILLEEVAAGAVVAYAHFDVDGGVGRVIHVAVDREWRSAGVGRALMAEVATRLKARGCRQWSVDVRADNAAALRLFVSLEFRVVPGADPDSPVLRMEGAIPSAPE